MSIPGSKQRQPWPWCLAWRRARAALLIRSATVSPSAGDSAMPMLAASATLCSLTTNGQRHLRHDTLGQGRRVRGVSGQWLYHGEFVASQPCGDIGFAHDGGTAGSPPGSGSVRLTRGPYVFIDRLEPVEVDVVAVRLCRRHGRPAPAPCAIAVRTWCGWPGRSASRTGPAGRSGLPRPSAATCRGLPGHGRCDRHRRAIPLPPAWLSVGSTTTCSAGWSQAPWRQGDIGMRSVSRSPISVAASLQASRHIAMLTSVMRPPRSKMMPSEVASARVRKRRASFARRSR